MESLRGYTIESSGFTFQSTDDEGCEWAVVGRPYVIKFMGRPIDSEYVSLWACDCPGYRYRGTCKHTKAFFEALNEARDVIP